MPHDTLHWMSSATIFNLLEDAAERYGDAPALHQPRTVGGTRNLLTYSWNDYRRAAEEIAAGLRSMGLQKGDVVALNSETRLEFYICDLGIIANGSISAALYPSYPPADLIQTLAACDAKGVFVEDPPAFQALRAAPVPTWILMTGSAEGAITLEELRERGRQALAADPGLMTRMKAGTQASDPAILYLTSGATGEPKMALVSHEAVLANVQMGPHALPMSPQDATVAFLPSAHIAQRIVMEMLPIPGGMPVTFAESLLKLPQEIKTVRPTVFLAPPRMWERVYSTICTEIRKRPAAVRKLFYGALGLGQAAARCRREGKSVPAHIAVPLRLADRLVFRTIRARFGGRLRVPVSGAAPLSSDLAEFYEAIGMPLVEGYGLTEGGVVTFNPIDAPRPGSIGKALPGVQLKVADDGELLVQTPCVFLGYYKQPQATAEVLRDGWLHTGDIAYRDAAGYFYITGRKKELIVSSTGKKIYPARVESLFKTEPLVSQVLLIGDRLPYLTALVTINPSAAASLKGVDGYGNMHPNDLAVAPPVVAEVRKIVNRVNKRLAQFEQIRRFRILPRDFSIENGELTATMKVRRAQVLANFKADVDELYGERECPT
jgi:long-chain acyl-CoA synthetase